MRTVIASIYCWIQSQIDKPLCYHGHTYKCEYPLYMIALGDLKLLPPYGAPVANISLPIRLSALAPEDELASVRGMISQLTEKLSKENQDRKMPIYHWDMNSYPPDEKFKTGVATYSWPIYHEEIVGDEMKLAVAEITFDIQFVWHNN